MPFLLHASGLLVSLKSLCAVLLNSSSVPYDTGHRDAGHGDLNTLELSKPGARGQTLEQHELLVV